VQGQSRARASLFFLALALTPKGWARAGSGPTLALDVSGNVCFHSKFWWIKYCLIFYITFIMFIHIVFHQKGHLIHLIIANKILIT